MDVQSVVVLNDFCHAQGGASRVAIDEAVALNNAGLGVTFVGAVGPVCSELRCAGITTICLEQPELADARQHPAVVLQTLWNRQAYRAVTAVLATHDRRRTVVHLHGYTKALTTTPALAARRAGFPTICTLHDFFAACPNGALYDYRRQRPCDLRALSARCMTTACDKRHVLHKGYRVARGLVQRHVADFPSSVHDYIALSRRSAALLRPYLPAQARIHELANIIDVARMPPVDVGANRALLVVGRLDVEKGVGLAVEAAGRIGQPIVCVGDGPLRAQVEAAGGRVTGWLAADEVQGELTRARCLVFPSLWYETYGLVVDEAAARGVPAIVSDVTAPAERVADGLSGWVFPTGSVDELAQRMALARDDAVVRAAGAAAYAGYWAAPSAPSSHAIALAAIYDAMLSRRASA